VPLIFLSLWLFLCFGFDLGSDESHYILYSQNLDWSYFDHPPLVGWIHFFFQSLLGFHTFSARLPSLLLGLWTLFELNLLIKSDRNSSLFFTFFSALVPFALILFLLPDTPLIPLSLGAYRYTLALTQKNSNKKSLDWILLGIFLGFAGLSKYSAVLLIPPIFIFLLYHQGLNLFKIKAFYLMSLTALCIISPVLFWNFQEDFISFRYQLHHVVGSVGSEKQILPFDKKIENFLASFFMQWIGYGILLLPYLAYLVGVSSLKVIKFCYSEKRIFFSKEKSSFLRKYQRYISQRLVSQKFLSEKSEKIEISVSLAALIAITWSLFFIKSSLSTVTLPHWTAVGWIFWLLAYEKSFQKNVRLLKAQRVFNFLILICLSLVLWLPISFQHQINLKEIKGWPELLSYVDTFLDPDDILYVTNWSYGSRANLYSPQTRQRKVQVADHRYDQFDLWESRWKTLSQKKGKLILFKEDSFEFSSFPLQCKKILEKNKVQDLVYQKWSHEFDLYSCEEKPNSQ
jgi:hypothetical protein